MNEQEANAVTAFEKIQAYVREHAPQIQSTDVDVMAKHRHEVALSVAGLDPEPWESLNEPEQAYERFQVVYGLWATLQAGFVITEPSFHEVPAEDDEKSPDSNQRSWPRSETTVNDTEPPPSGFHPGFPKEEPPSISVYHRLDPNAKAPPSGEFEPPFGVLELDLETGVTIDKSEELPVWGVWVTKGPEHDDAKGEWFYLVKPCPKCDGHRWMLTREGDSVNCDRCEGKGEIPDQFVGTFEEAVCEVEKDRPYEGLRFVKRLPIATRPIQTLNETKLQAILDDFKAGKLTSTETVRTLFVEHMNAATTPQAPVPSAPDASTGAPSDAPKTGCNP